MTSPAHMTCREFNEFVMDYISSELAEDVRDEFERHLEGCANCVRYIETYKITVTLGRLAFDSLQNEPPAEVPEELIQAILSAQRNV